MLPARVLPACVLPADVLPGLRAAQPACRPACVPPGLRAARLLVRHGVTLAAHRTLATLDFSVRSRESIIVIIYVTDLGERIRRPPGRGAPL